MEENSTRCNHSCVHCFRYSAEELAYQDMKTDEFRLIVNNAISSGIRKLVFSGWGEPTINPYFGDMLEFAKSRGLYVVVNTNGSLIGKYINFLLDLADELYISIDAVDASIYEQIRKASNLSALSSDLVQLAYLKKSRRTQKPIIKAIFTITRFNVDQMLKLPDYAVDVGIQEIYLSHCIPYVGGIEKIDCLSDQECLSRLSNHIDKIAVRLISMPIKMWLPKAGYYTSRICPFINNKALFVGVDGKISPCMYMAHSWHPILGGVKRTIKRVVIGDALRENIVYVWHKNANMIFKLYFNYMPSCIDCELVNWCSYTLSNEVDCWGNSPNCSHCPYHYRLSYCPL
ncbi:MAG: radical SAM protein [Desulfurococcaceae archaeon]